MVKRLKVTCFYEAIKYKIKQERLKYWKVNTDNAVADETFDIHAVNSREGESDAIVQLADALYMTPNHHWI